MTSDKAVFKRAANVALPPEITTIQAFAQLTATVLDLEDLLGAGLDILSQAFPFDLFAVMLTQDQNEDDLVIKAFHSEASPTLLDTLSPFLNRALQENTPVKRTDITSPLNSVDDSTAPHIRACLIIPLSIGRLVIGGLVVASFSPYKFSPQQEQLLSIFASQITVAVNNARLYAKTREHQQQELVRRQIANHLQKLSTIINATLDLDDVLNRILQHIEVVIPYHSALIMLLDGTNLAVNAAAGYPSEVQGTIVAADQGMIFRQVLLQQYPAVFTDLSTNTFWRLERAAFMNDVKAWIGAPLVIKNRIIGMLTLHHKEAGYFDHADLDLVHTFANQAAVAIDNAQLYQREQQKVKQFQIVAKIGRHATEIYEVQPLMDAVVDRLHQDLEYEYVTIFLYRPHLEGLVLKSSNDISTNDMELAFINMTDEGIISTVARRAEPLLVNDVSAFEGYFCPPGRESVQSEVAIPLVTKGHLVGVLDLQSSKRHAFSPDDITLAQTVADQIAVALETANLFEARDQRLAELIAFNQIGIAIATPSNLDDTLEAILQRIKALYQVEGASFLMLENNRLHFRVAVGVGEDALKPFSLALGEGFAGWVATNNRPLRVNNVSEDRRHSKLVDQSLNLNTQTLLAVPVQIQGRVLGVIEVMNRLDDRRFTQDDEVILSFIASAVAITIENARLFAELTRTASRIATLFEASQAMTNMNLDALLRDVARQSWRLLTPQQVSIYLPDGEQMRRYTYTPKQSEDINIRSESLSTLRDGPVVWVLQNKRLFKLTQPQQNDKLTFSEAQTGKNLLIVPLIIDGRVIAAIEVLKPADDNPFSISDETLLTTLARQAAVAIHNARLFQTVLEREETALTLGKAGISINQSLDLDDVLAVICEQSFKVFNIDSVQVWRLKDDVLQCIAAQGVEANDALDKLLPPQNTHRLACRVFQSADPISHNEFNDVAAYAPRLSQNGPEHIAVLGVPLQWHGQPIGTLLMANTQNPTAFAEQDKLRAVIYANQATTAIENAHLHHETERRLTEVSTLYTLAYRMTANVNINILLEDIVSVIRLVLDSQGCNVFIVEDDKLILGAENGSMSIAGHAFIHKATQQILHTMRPINYETRAAFPDTADPPPKDLMSLSILPLLVQGRLVGALAVYDKKAYAFSENEGRMLTVVAAQVASAIENSMLFKDLQQHTENLEKALDELRELHRLQVEFIQNVSHELRTPITFIKGYVDLVVEGSLGELPAEAAHSLEIVARRTDDLTRLINDIITHQQLEMNVLKFKTINLNQSIPLMLESAKPTALNRGVSLHLDLPESLPSIKADPDRLNQIFDNLLGNALKFTEEGGSIRVTAQQLPEAIEIAISDTGIGIPPEEQTKIFNRFYQADGSTTRRYGGTGLGLTIVKQIVEAHHGTIRVESEVGTGTTFYFTLPLRQSTPEAADT